LWPWLAEKLQTGYLPVYVSDDPDAMPSTRLYEGNMRGIMDLLSRLESKMVVHETAITGLVQEIRTLKGQSKSIVCMIQASASGNVQT